MLAWFIIVAVRVVYSNTIKNRCAITSIINNVRKVAFVNKIGDRTGANLL